MAPFVPTSPDARLDELEARIQRLEVALFEARPLASGAEPEPADFPGEPVAPRLPRASRASPLILDVLAQTGWSVLTLAGAFLIRALTDRGAVATTPGVAFGLAYALAIMVLSDRAAARGNRLTAAFLGSTGAFIANAIVAETTTRLGIVSPTAGLAILAAWTAIVLAVGRRHDLPALDWTATLAACVTAVFLAVEAGVPALSGILLLALATATSWFGVARWSWRLLAWLPTICAVGLSIWTTSDALTTSPAPGPPVAFAMILALGLPVLWLGSALLHALARRPQVGGLAIVQAFFALSVGLGGALRLAAARGTGPATLATAALACGAGSYLLAFLHERDPQARASRLYFAWLGLSLVVIGSGVLFPAPAPALLWSALCLTAVILARAFEPAVFQPQGAVFATVAAAAAGLLGASTRAFTGGVNELAPLSPVAFVTLAAVTAAAVFLLTERSAAGSLPAFFATLFSAMGIGALAVLTLYRPASALLAAPLPALRTVVISLSAYVLARLWRSTGRPELRTLAYLALVAGGLKLLFEDLPGGTPITLFVAFVFYGGALLLIPRLMRTETRAPAPAG
jgi:hypothetical protein